MYKAGKVIWTNTVGRHFTRVQLIRAPSKDVVQAEDTDWCLKHPKGLRGMTDDALVAEAESRC